MRHRGPHGEEHAGEVDPDDRVPLVERRLVRGAGAGDAGAGHHAVDAPERPRGRRHGILDRGGVPTSQAKACASPPSVFSAPATSWAASARASSTATAALGDEAAGSGCADAAASAGDDGAAISEPAARGRGPWGRWCRSRTTSCEGRSRASGPDTSGAIRCSYACTMAARNDGERVGPGGPRRDPGRRRRTAGGLISRPAAACCARSRRPRGSPGHRPRHHRGRPARPGGAAARVGDARAVRREPQVAP